MKILITGASGYIGSHLAQNLLQQGHTVVGIDWKAPRIQGYIHYQQDIRDATSLDGVISDHLPDAVVHLAALRVPACDLSPRDAMDINYGGTVSVISSAQRHRVPRVIFASSCSVYGFPDRNVTLSETDHIEPVSAYSVSKAMSEEWIQSNRSEHTSTVCLRFATAYGLAEFVREDLMVNQFVRQAVAGETVKIFQPAAWRPFCHVRDLVRACMIVLQTDSMGHSVYNVGFNDVWKHIQQCVPQAQMLVEAGVKDPRDYQIEFDRFCTEFNFQSQHGLSDSIGDLVVYFNQ